jgi:hypothetical protein
VGAEAKKSMITFLLAFGLILTTAPLLASDEAAAGAGGSDSAESTEISAIEKFFIKHNHKEVERPALGWPELFTNDFFSKLKSSRNAGDIESVFYSRVIIDNVYAPKESTEKTLYGLYVAYGGANHGQYLTFSRTEILVYDLFYNHTIKYRVLDSNHAYLGTLSGTIEPESMPLSTVKTSLLPFINLLEE